MDIEKLIRRLRNDADAYRNGETLGRAFADQEDVLDNAATALSTLQAENEKLRDEVESLKKEHCAGCYVPVVEAERLRDLNEAPKLRAELEQVKHALAMMWFAYVNSDKETPHSYETEAIEEAERLLGPWEECMPKYLRRGQKED